MKVKTFAELEATEKVSPADLRASLKDYAKGGWAIKGWVVVAIINRTPLSPKDLTDLLWSANAGVYIHNKMQEPREVAEYQQVVDRLKRAISHANSGFFQVLGSGFKPGKFKNVGFLWIGLCLGAMLLGKLTNNTLTFYSVPAMTTLFFVLILALVYQVKKPKK